MSRRRRAVKAVRIHEYGGPEVLVYEDVPKPEAGEGKVLVRVEAATVNPVDVAVREDRFPTPKKPPKIIGSDGAGVVEAVGPGVTEVVPGEEVFFSGLGVGSEGSYAEYTVIAEAQAVTKPPELSFVEAAAMGMVFPPPTTASSRAATRATARRCWYRAAAAAWAAPRSSSPSCAALACSRRWRADGSGTSSSSSAPMRPLTSGSRTCPRRSGG
jgi:hypothetical protein